MTDNLVSVRQMLERFENIPVEDGEFEIEAEVTIKVLVSIYRSYDNAGVLQKPYCHFQPYGSDAYEAEYGGAYGDLHGSDDEMVSDILEMCEALNISPDAEIWTEDSST
jgi:hypothetical protein